MSTHALKCEKESCNQVKVCNGCFLGVKLCSSFLAIVGATSLLL